jgi:hypothetical protein
MEDGGPLSFLKTLASPHTGSIAGGSIAMERRLCRTLVAVATVALLCLPPSARGWLDPTQPDVITVLDGDDNRFTSVSSEVELSYGASSGSRIKGHQDLLGMKFDLSAYRGMTIEAAELHLALRSADSVTSLAATTINTDWQEGTGTGSRTVGAPCYRWRVTPVSSSVFTTADNEWTFPYSEFSSAAFGNYGSLVCYGFAANDTYKTYTGPGTTYGWIAMKIDPALVHALILDQYGMTVTDARWHSGASGPNPTVYTKDQNNSVRPRLYIKFAGAVDTVPPGAVQNLAAQAGPESGQVVLSFGAPLDPQAAKAFGYTVRYSTTNDFAGATNLARWRIPRPKLPGMPQKVLLEGLTAGTTYYFFVQAYDAAGNGGAVQSVSLAPPTIATPVLADGPFVTPDPTGKSIQAVPGVMRWWAASEVSRVNPVTGNRYEDGYTGSGSDNYKKANVVWDSATNTISLLAARNEMVGAQLILENLTAGSLTNVGVTAGDLTGTDGRAIPAATSIELFQMHYVPSGSARYAEAAIPLAAPFATTFSIPDTNRNPTGKNQSVWVDVYVPKNANAIDYTGTLTVTATQLSSPVTVNLKVHVANVTIPDYPTFLVDLNGYSNPWNWVGTSAGNDLSVLRYFQVCHKHRVVPNALPYGWGANVQSDRVPNTMTGSGPTLHATSWATFDRRYGPLFDGTAFSPTNPTQPYNGPGMNTPITHFYSTFFESWPIHMLDPIYGFDATGLGGGAAVWTDHYWYQLKLSNIVTFFQTLPDVWDAYTDGYKQGLRNVMADWVQHAHDKGWTKTAFETYHNHKYSYAGCAVFWVMEENDGADDFRADGFYHQLWRDGYAQANCPDVKWHFRIDISDRWGLNYGQLDNLINYWDFGSGAASTHWPQIKYRNYGLDQDKQEDWIVYSDSPSSTGSGLSSAQIFLRRWSQGFVGSLPYWSNFNGSWSSFPDPPGVIYSGQSVPGQATAYEGCLLSIRAKQMRQAQQIIEMLNLWAGTNGMNREQARNSVFAKYGNGSWDYGYTGVNDVNLYRMRADLLAKLESAATVPGDANGDGFVDVVDLLMLVGSFGTASGDPLYDAACDFNNDGFVDVVDLLILVANWPA